MLLGRPRRAGVTLLAVIVVAIGLGVFANSRASYDTAPDTIVDPGSTAFRHEVEFENTFGADPFVMLLRTDVKGLLGGDGLVQEVNAEGNLYTARNRQLGVKTLFGPAAIATVAANAILGAFFGQLQQAGTNAYNDAFKAAKAVGKSDADAKAAGTQAAKDAQQRLINDAVKTYPQLAQIGIPAPTNTAWMKALFLRDNKLKPQFQSVLPDQHHILVTARLSPDTNQAAVQRIVDSETAALRQNPIPGTQVIMSGAPVLEVAAARALRLALVAGMLLGIVAMALMLVLGLSRAVRVVYRLVPLAAGLCTVLILAGAVTAIGIVAASLRAAAGFEQPALQSVLASVTIALNPATLAAFPIAMGLGVDYAVQFLVRYRQALGDDVSRAQAWDAARRGAGRATLRAALCTAAGLLALLVSGIPMVRQFGVVMIIAALLAWSLGRLMVLGVVRLWPQVAYPPAAGIKPSPRGEEVALFGLGPATATERATNRQQGGEDGGRVAQWAERAVEVARRRSAAMLLPALAVACIGWATFPFSSYESDPERLVSPNLPAFKDLTAIRQATGSSGEMDFILSGPDVTSPDALSWVKDLESAAQKDTQGRFRPVASLSSLLNDVTGGKDLTADRIKALLAVMPQFFTSALIDSCPSREPCQHHLARVAFGINLAPVAQQQKDVEAVLNDVGPPAGYSYYAAGLSYLGVKGLENLESGQLVLNLLAAALVLIALLAIYRQRVAALLAWVPTLLVAGWSSAVLFVLQQSLTPMTAVLGALIVAFGTEFAVLWLERYREARTAGVAAGEAAARQASRAAAPGIAVSGAALALGFLALAVSVLPGLSQRGFDMPMVRNFGLVAAMDIVLAVLAALVVLPALVVRFKLDPAAAHPATEERRT